MLSFQTLRDRSVPLLAAMVLFQVLWLVAIWLTGASTELQKLIVLGVYSLVCGVVVAGLSKATLQRLKALLDRLTSDGHLTLTLIIAVIFLIGIGYASVQRVWTWDEEYNFAASRMIANRGLGAFFENYTQIPWLGNRHPPLIPILNGFAMRVFGVNLFLIRFITLIFGLGTILITYLLGRMLYDRNTGLLASVVLISFPLIFRLSTAALTDIPVTFFFSLALLTTFRLLEKASIKLAVALGLVMGLGLLTKYTMLSIFLVFFGFFLFSSPFRKRTLYIGLAVLISLSIFAAWVVFAYSIGARVPGIPLDRFFSQPVAGAPSPLPPPGAQVNPEITINPGWFLFDPGGVRYLLNSLFTKLPSSIGLYNIPLIIFGLIVLARRKDQRDRYLILWIVMVTIFLILTLPDHRYFMPTFPALALLVGLALPTTPELSDRIILLALLYGVGAMYLFVDWFREAELFVR